MSTHADDSESAVNPGPQTSSGLPPNTPDGTDATADSPGGPVDTGKVEGDAAGGNTDPDLTSDGGLDAEDPA